MLELRFTLPGQSEQSVPLDQSRLVIGALLSNQIVVRAALVEPIHGLIEALEEDSPAASKKWQLTDLGSEAGIQVNGKFIDVETSVKIGDVITIGSVELLMAENREPVAAAVQVPPPPPPGRFATTTTTTPQAKAGAAGALGTAATSGAATVLRTPDARGGQRPGQAIESQMPRSGVLFSPKAARPAGDVLEAVAYWGDTVLDVDYFHPSIKGNEQVLIGDPTGEAHLIAAGPDNITSHALVSMSSSGFRLRLLPGMRARLRRGGKIEKVEGPAKINLDRRDIAMIKYGAVSYFLMNIRPPVLEIPKRGLRDPFFTTILSIGMLIFALFIPLTFIIKPKPEDKKKDDIWAIVNLPETVKPPEPTPKPLKQKVEIQEVKVPPPVVKAPPPPKPMPVKAVKPIEKEKVEQPKPVEKPVPEKKPTQLLTEATKPSESQQQPQKPQPKIQDKLDKLAKASGGIASADSKKPDFKYAGPQNNKPMGAAGGAKGSGMNQKGGEIKGNKAASVKGVEGVASEKPSGVNLDKLGLGAGKVLNKSSASAIYTNMQSSAGGAGGGMGSGAKTYGLGGAGGGKSLGLAGAGGAVNNFGSGSGGLLGGQGGLGGAGGAGGGKGAGFGGGAGHGRANVEVPPGDPVVSGGLSAQEILQVVRANLNQIRHCYEQLLQRSPSASGKLAVNWTINAQGSVTSVRIGESTISDSQMKGCVTGRIQRWKFPDPRGGQTVEVSYPFTFNPI